MLSAYIEGGTEYGEKNMFKDITSAFTPAGIGPTHNRKG
jgi:hypothetical protein